MQCGPVEWSGVVQTECGCVKLNRLKSNLKIKMTGSPELVRFKNVSPFETKRDPGHCTPGTNLEYKTNSNNWVSKTTKSLTRGKGNELAQDAYHEINAVYPVNVHPQISLALLSLTTSSLLTSLSTSSKRPSHSAQHSPPPTSPTSYHLCNTLAVRTRSSEIVPACSSWPCATRSSCGCSWMSAAEV